MQRKRTITPPTFFTELCPFEFFFLWKLCLLYNFHTFENIFMKLCTNINHHQMMFREKRNYAPLKLFLWKSCLLYNFNTVENIEILYKYKPPSDDVQRTRTVAPSTSLWNYAPSKFFLRELCLQYNFNTDENIFMKLRTNINQLQSIIRRCAEIVN